MDFFNFKAMVIIHTILVNKIAKDIREMWKQSGYDLTWTYCLKEAWVIYNEDIRPEITMLIKQEKSGWAVTDDYKVITQPEVVQPEVVQPEVVQPKVVQPEVVQWSMAWVIEKLSKFDKVTKSQILGNSGSLVFINPAKLISKKLEKFI